MSFAICALETARLPLTVPSSESDSCFHKIRDIRRLWRSKISLKPDDVLVVWKLDRLTRSLSDLLQINKRLEEIGAGFRSLTGAIDTMETFVAAKKYQGALLRTSDREPMPEKSCNPTRAGLETSRATKQNPITPTIAPSRLLINSR
jgi:hypothetical protein